MSPQISKDSMKDPEPFLVDPADSSKKKKINPEWIRFIENKDPAFARIRAYFLSGPSIKARTLCRSETCKMPNRTSKFKDLFLNKDVHEPMMLCFFCNRTFHCKCAQIKRIKDEHVPWRCVMCAVDLDNYEAQMYFNLHNYSIPLAERRTDFVNVSSEKQKEDEFDTEEEYDVEDQAAFNRNKPEAPKEKLQSDKPVELNEAAIKKMMMDTMSQFMTAMQERNSTAIDNANSSFNFTQFYNNGHQPSSEKSTYEYKVNPLPSSSSQSQQSQPSSSNQTQDNRSQSSNPWSQTNQPNIADLLNRLTVSHEKAVTQKELADRRKVMSKIAEFDGDPAKWIEFSQDVQRYKVACQYDDETVKGHLRGALKGEAFNSVKNTIDFMTLDQVMDTLRDDYGDPMVIVRRNAKMLKDFKIPNLLYREDAVKIKQAIQAYFAACTYAKTGYINSNELGEHLYNQFDKEDRARIKEMHFKNNPNDIHAISLTSIHDYIISRLHFFDERPESNKVESNRRDDKKTRSNQIQYASATTSKNGRDDKIDAKFQIQSKENAPYLGYDLAKVAKLNKTCIICEKKGHFPVQCYQYQAMSEEQRNEMINKKNICRRCVLTGDHNARACDIKMHCGYNMGKNARCSGKHHISIHNVCANYTSNQRFGNNRPKKGNTNRNTEQAKKLIEASKNGVASISKVEEDQSSMSEPAPVVANNFHSVAPKVYDVKPPIFNGMIQINLHSMNFQKTVKMFKHDFIGPRGTVTAFSVGDSAAEVTLVREDLRQALGIEGVPETLSMAWTDNTTKVCRATKFDLVVQGVLKHSSRLILKDCYAIDDLNLPERSLDMNVMRSKFPYLRGIDFEGYENEQPVMLIGTPHAFAIESIKELIEGGTGNPVAIESKLGVSVYGGSPDEKCANPEMVQSTAVEEEPDVEEQKESQWRVTNEDLHDLLKKFNSIESIGIRPANFHLIDDERKAIEILQEEMRVLEDGTVEVPLIWNRDKDKKIPKLDNNFSLAYKRQLVLEKKLSKNPQHRKAYNDNVKEAIDNGYMRFADDGDMNQQWPNIWYLPMGLVINANKDPPKFRNVYDARCRYNGRSLNDLLLKGQDLLINLVKPLLQWRMNKIAISADIQHMFHRIQICLRDQQCQRILFREDPSQPMKTMILSRMAFGPKSSPFVSQYVKNWNASNWMLAYPDAAKAAIDKIYMDDALISESTVDKAIQIAKQLIEIFNHINWKLVSFQSNSIEFLKSLPQECIKKDLIPIIMNKEDEHVTKILGCSWNTIDDVFIFQLNKNIFVKLMTECDHKPTKKDLASLIARIFDVHGFISHYTIRGKILLQRAWKLKIGWDERIPDELNDEWRRWLVDIENIAKLKIPRQLCDLDSIVSADKIQLHTFCDAGVEAFGASSYLVVHNNNKVTSRLVMAKAKVTPLRFHSETEIKEIPRLELNSALIAVRLSKSISEALSELNFEKFFWSDSEIVLRWILNPNHRLLKYAVGPIEEILEHSSRQEWRYVPSVLNPADTCTKFKKFDFADMKSIWFLGPDFIQREPKDWPQIPAKLTIDNSNLMYNVCLKKLNYSTHILPPSDCDDFIGRLSPSILASWSKLRRAVARALKILLDGMLPLIKAKTFNDKAARKEMKQLNHSFKILSPMDFERAEHFIFRKIQREAFPEEYKALLSNNKIKNNDFQRLNVFMDPQGLMRINSRANLNDLNFPQQFTPVLPRKGDFVYALLRFYHIKYDHIALESQLAEIRTKCWIPKLRQELKITKSRCNECKLRDKMMYEPAMAPLPDFRINPSQSPFEVVALDCFGPYIVKCSGRFKKIWILIFTCTLTRFVHLHILETLESLRVLEAIVVFWAAHGPVMKFVSDNGLNFVGTANIFKEDYENARLFLKKQHTLLGQKLSERYQIEWEFIPAYSPWMGGVYERLIKECKRALYEILNKRKIEKVELNIAINEVSHRLNLRPLTYNSISADDDIILTPHHLAKFKSGWPLLPGIHKGQYANISDKDMYRKGRALADQIMAKFTANYLPEYARRTKWFKDKREVKVDDLVLIIEPRDTRKEFTRGRIIKIRSNKDGKGRRADVLLADGRIKLCAVRNLARLDISV